MQLTRKMLIRTQILLQSTVGGCDESDNKSAWVKMIQWIEEELDRRDDRRRKRFRNVRSAYID